MGHVKLFSSGDEACIWPFAARASCQRSRVPVPLFAAWKRDTREGFEVATLFIFFHTCLNAWFTFPSQQNTMHLTRLILEAVTFAITRKLFLQNRFLDQACETGNPCISEGRGNTEPPNQKHPKRIGTLVNKSSGRTIGGACCLPWLPVSAVFC